jgi:hypothetical protein
MTVTTTTLISNPSLLSVIIFGGVCYPAVFASANGCVSASRSSAELGLDAVGLLQAGLEQLLDERPVSGRPGVAQLAAWRESGEGVQCILRTRLRERCAARTAGESCLLRRLPRREGGGLRADRRHQP